MPIPFIIAGIAALASCGTAAAGAATAAVGAATAAAAGVATAAAAGVATATTVGAATTAAVGAAATAAGAATAAAVGAVTTAAGAATTVISTASTTASGAFWAAATTTKTASLAKAAVHLGGCAVINNFSGSFIDNVIREKICYLPPGAVVYCDLLCFEHSGIYVGNDKIVHLDGSGDIELVSPKTFISRLGGFNNAISIYASCIGTSPVGSEDVANRALNMVGNYRNYNLVLDNCHQFSAGCLSGEFDNPCNFLWALKHEARNILGSDTWRIWDKDASELFGT